MLGPLAANISMYEGGGCRDAHSRCFQSLRFRVACLADILARARASSDGFFAEIHVPINIAI